MTLRCAAALGALFFATACAQTAFHAAREQDTAAAYRAFLHDHPDDENAETARLLLSDREFEAAEKQHTLLAYKRFLDEYPDAPKAPTARALLETMRFNAAKEQNTSQGWRMFLRDHPDGAHREEAERLLAEAEFREAGPEADVKALARLAREHPDDPRRAQLEVRLDDQAFADAVKAGAFPLYDYLRDFPAGAHREQAQAELFGLHVRSLLFSGKLAEAKAALGGSPLTPKLPHAAAWVAAAEARARALQAKDPLVQAAQTQHYLRGLEDLKKSLHAPDPLDRWEAAEELGQQVTADAIDPLLDAFARARNPLIRERAFASLRQVLRALPPEVADYEVASRVEALRQTAAGPDTWVVLAALLDAGGRLQLAATEYQRAWDPHLPDPVILRRWTDIRRDRRQYYSSAVAARQLAVWAGAAAKELELPPAGTRLAVSDARELCAAARNAHFALEAITEAKAKAQDFPEDLARFELTATEAVRLADARLKDAELRLRTQDPHARTCDDERVAKRLEDSVKERLQALRALEKKGGAVARTVLVAARDADPSPEVRALAASLYEAQPAPP